MRKKKLKKSELQNFSDTITRHFDVVSENQDKKWNLVAEQYEGITKNIDGIKGEIVGIKGEIVGIKGEIKGIKDTLTGHTEMIGNLATDMQAVKTTLAGHTEMIGKLSIDMTVVKEQLEFINSGLKRKVDVDEFFALQKRVSLLEKVRK